jgi:hypothetical protein
MQVKMLNRFFHSLSRFEDTKFKLGICTVSTFHLDAEYDNISVANYGWVNEKQLQDISREYAFGLLPLSFEQKDERFYRTSLMTKIPFYLSVLLPVICIGPESSSAVKVIRQDKVGLCLTSNEEKDFTDFAKLLLSVDNEVYRQLQSQINEAAAERFNIRKIMDRFYFSLTPEF